ncbi:MAG: MlaE family lipid transporter permease subunit, partial [Methylobacterium brachiatum]|nr:MlaE family lipid transporter permease subunit [Methylobacterium brachiatum]
MLSEGMVPGASLRDRPADGRLALDGRWTADQA